MQIYINKNGQQHGPFEENAVFQMLQNGQLSPNDLGIRQDQNQWSPLSVLFPQIVKPFNNMPLPVDKPVLSPPVAAKKSGSNLLLFSILGLVGFFVIGIIGLAAVMILRTNSRQSRNSYNSNSSNTSATPLPTPTPDPYKVDSEIRTKFEPHEAEFVKLPAKAQISKQPYLKGKIVLYMSLVNFGDKDTVWSLENSFASPNSSEAKLQPIMAKTPEEVETVVLRTCKQLKKGNYLAGGKTLPGYFWRCEVVIVDRSLEAVIGRKTFTGKLDDVVNISATATEIEGNMPLTEMAEYTSGLPRK